MGFKRLLIGDKMEHYYTKETKSKSNIKKVTIKIKNIVLELLTDNGVFSKKGLDFGTRCLLENLYDIKGDVLDIGCGYGPIGIYVAKRYNAKVTMSDINQRAISLAKKNTYLNKVDCEVIQSDMYENIIGSYDHIITNPPIRIGKEKLYYLLKEAKQHLKPNGNLWLVVNKNQGAKSLVKELEKDYLVQIIDKNKGFYIILARNC